ncbi:hypothetical protein AB1Y20_014580 [Prymnesium parvum]|uniref:DNA-directed RNA polymerase n=1 Tax=Prymnesium parvum TaxID=97485 RepID=A0AB34IDN9_PRYPA
MRRLASHLARRARAPAFPRRHKSSSSSLMWGESLDYLKWEQWAMDAERWQSEEHATPWSADDEPELWQTFSSDVLEAEASGQLSGQLSGELTAPELREDLPERLYVGEDVFGKKVDLMCPKMADASSLDPDTWTKILKQSIAFKSWERALQQGMLDSLSPVDRLQARQEMRELRLIEQGIQEYRARFARELASRHSAGNAKDRDKERKFTAQELLDRSNPRHVVRTNLWFERISTEISNELGEALDRLAKRKPGEFRKYLNEPGAKWLSRVLVREMSPTQRDLAILQLCELALKKASRDAWHEERPDGSETRFETAMKRLEALDPLEPSQVFFEAVQTSPCVAQDCRDDLPFNALQQADPVGAKLGNELLAAVTEKTKEEKEKLAKKLAVITINSSGFMLLQGRKSKASKSSVFSNIGLQVQAQLWRDRKQVELKQRIQKTRVEMFLMKHASESENVERRNEDGSPSPYMLMKYQVKRDKQRLVKMDDMLTASIRPLMPQDVQADSARYNWDHKIQMGSYLWDKMLRLATINGEENSAFCEEEGGNHFLAARGVYSKVITGNLGALKKHLYFDHDPMLTPPLQWTKLPGELPRGGFLHNPTIFVRTNDELHLKRLRDCDPAQLAPVLEGLNAVQKTGWRINNRVLQLVHNAWNLRLDVPFLPERFTKESKKVSHRQQDLLVKRMGREWDTLDEIEQHERLEQLQQLKNERYAREKYEANTHSELCTAKLTLAVAEMYRDDVFYFAHNIDFRGRVYPMSPHLSHVNNDLCRGLLLFAESKPLGEHGLFWLKVHLANLYGHTKLSFEERTAWVDDVISSGRLNAVVNQPFDESNLKWWAEADSPLQMLAACMELEKAVKSPSPELYRSNFPVHQDGSCNGLQHYAALGRDLQGGSQVNLVPSTQPQDVYSEVMRSVIQKVEADASSHENEKIRTMAQLLQGKITRKVVKQTVMTSVYGVTLKGASDQVLKRLEDIQELKTVQDSQLREMASYVARHTLGSLSDSFAGGTQTMNWLRRCARAITKQVQSPVEWTTPLGLPVVQPYYAVNEVSIRTVAQRMKLQQNVPDKLNTLKHQNGFPPNYVHSLDASHMLMSARRCVDSGVTFAAVHDSYWTHASSVPLMNKILREEFVALHTPPLLEHLRDSFAQRYSDTKDAPEWESDPELSLPTRGELDLDKVKDSPYFFA